MMEEPRDKQWASKYLLDPLTAPEPSEETGPGTNHVKTFGSSHQPPTSRASSDKKHNTSAHVQQTSSRVYPSPPQSTSPRAARSSHRQKAYSDYEDTPTERRSLDQASTEVPTSSTGLRRNSSLTSRFPGDKTHRPLDIIKRETKLANRAPHLRKNQFVGPDSIDSLDTAGGKYHHAGPFDATLLARNLSPANSPVQAVSRTNKEALKATPSEKVKDSVEKHRPLDGVAIVPPGMMDREGRTYDYEEGADLMIEEGNYRRWPGMNYLPEDLKGKGEPSYSIEKALKDHKQHKGHRRMVSDGNSGIEMASRPRSSDGESRATSNEQNYTQWEGDMRRSNTTDRRNSGLLKKRFGSSGKSK